MSMIYRSPHRRYKGYHKPRFSWMNPRARWFSNTHLLIVVVLVAVGVLLLTWGLSFTQTAP